MPLTPAWTPLRYHPQQYAMWRTRARFVAADCGRGSGKALALDTAIPTPRGFIPMGDIVVGDVVFDEFGETCNVIAVSEVYKDHDCYKLTFDDGSSVIADAGHQWITRDANQRKNLARQKYRVQRRWSLVTTSEIAATLYGPGGKRDEINHSIDVSATGGAIRQLPIPPYVIGVWLGDGNSHSAQLTSADPEIIDHLRAEGQPVSEGRRYSGNLSSKALEYHLGQEQRGLPHIRDATLQARLRKLNLLRNKHIPVEYLFASFDQRLALLQGLMDTDGCCDENKGCEFSASNERLAFETHALICSLGIKATIRSRIPICNGKRCRRSFRVCFTTNLPVFRLKRKLERIPDDITIRCRRRFIVSCERVESVPVRCIQVDSPSSLFLCTKSFIATHNSELARRRVVRFLPVEKPWPDPEYFYALPTQDQARTKHWEKIKALVPRDWIRSISEVRMEIHTVFGSKLSMIGLDKPHRAEGAQYDGGVLDESCDVKGHVFSRTFRPALTHRDGWCWRIGVPKRYGMGAREFRDVCQSWGNNGPNYAHFSWPSSDILTPEQIAEEAANLDSRDFNEQYMASWEKTTGAVYYSFDAESVKDWTYDPKKPLLVGSDFNVNPMAWIVCQIDGKTLMVFDELWLRDTNTKRTLDELHKRYGSHDAGWYFFGDASSKSRKTSASVTDYLQIRNDTRFSKSKVLYPDSNPAVTDRIASVNWAFKSASGLRSLYVSGKCLHLIKDLEYLAFREGSREIDTRDPDAGHITDALGYVVHQIKPMRLEGWDIGAQVAVM